MKMEDEGGRGVSGGKLTTTRSGPQSSENLPPFRYVCMYCNLPSKHVERKTVWLDNQAVHLRLPILKTLDLLKELALIKHINTCRILGLQNNKKIGKINFIKITLKTIDRTKIVSETVH